MKKTLCQLKRAVDEWLYGEQIQIPNISEDVDSRIREASHTIANDSAALKGVFHRLARNYDDPLAELVRRITKENGT